MLKKLFVKLEQDPKSIFIVDGIGALITAFSLGVVLMNLEGIFGIPKTTLRVLAIVPVLYVVYDCVSYFKAGKQVSYYLKGIAILNLMYCPLSIGLALYDGQRITLLGWTYLIIEVLVIFAIAIFELSLAKRLGDNNSLAGN